MQVEFQTYSGGLDQVSNAPYSITRYLFKSPPATLYAEDADAVVNAGLRHLFGNAYLMEEERATFYNAESKYRCGQISAKEFCREVAKSETYRKRFFEDVSQYRFIELNFKHFLGRAPLNQVEYSKHFKIFAKGGYEAEIDSYFDDFEYDTVFGEDVMPFTRFRGTYAPINQFNRMCKIEGGFAGSDKNKGQMLVSSLASNAPIDAYLVADGLPCIPNAEHPTKKYDLPEASLEKFKNEVEVAKAKAYLLQIELDKAYAKLEECRTVVDPFKAMISEMDIGALYGKSYGNGAVSVFSGQYIGAPADSWGPSGVDNINGPTRRPAAVIGKKEKQLERVKQLIVDLERQVAILQAEVDSPVVTPEPVKTFSLLGEEMPLVPVEEEEEPAPVVLIADPKELATVPDAREIAPGDAQNLLEALEIDEEDEESGLVKPKQVVISTKREFADVGKLPKELMEEMEAEKKASGKSFLDGTGPKPSFPGDGSEMRIGG